MTPSSPDILIIGAGFSGLYALYTLRTALPNLTIHILEAAPDIGGVWHWNRYPGARVDSEWPFYQLTIPAAWRDFYFTERFPDHTELRRYFAHLEETLHLKQDITFNARVNSAVWDESTSTWIVRTESGLEVHATYLLLCSGLLHLPYIPSFQGLERLYPFHQRYPHLHPSTNPTTHPDNTTTNTSSSSSSTSPTTHSNDSITANPNKPTSHPQIFHSSAYPTTLITTGKRIAVIGAGATGVQIVQSLSKTASQLTLFMRRPSPCLPMRNRALTHAEQDNWQPFLPALFHASRHSRSGIPFSPVSEPHGPGESIFELSDTEREKYYEELWKSGSFNFVARNFPQTYVSEEANKLAYSFWARKTRERMRDGWKRDVIAPKEPVDFLFTRRVPLEEDFYECVDRENVDVVRIKDGAVGLRFTERGGIVVLGEDGDGDGEERMFDAVVLATGFDSYVGAMADMNIRGRNGIDLAGSWQSAPTPLANGPTIIEIQISLIITLLTRLTSSQPQHQPQPSPTYSSKAQTKPTPETLTHRRRKATIEPTLPSQTAWRELIRTQAKGTLLNRTDSWWNGANISGKKKEVVTFLTGVQEYERVCLERINSDLDIGGRGLGGFAVDYGSCEYPRGGDGDGGIEEGIEDGNKNGYGKGVNGGVKGKEKRLSVYGLSGMLKRWGVGRS
ncbi:flavin-containing monooxygenase [Aspergillus affinis]|uniref:flavin-containing monooxygenase n=1 Tax=Aspergillus affinis TaxID=1070780 RepID=UPI0022FDB285|nr:uncharacterized protein KD926_005826 [Aspergillus affinis]KAI9045883.1 hypothetical protein KD926_005826 [Aspergillus affinis]